MNQIESNNQTNKRKNKTHRLQLGIHHLPHLANVIYITTHKIHITILFIATNAFLPSFGKVSLQLTNSHLARVERLRGLRLVSIVLDRAELVVVLVQFTNANVLSRHSERERTRNLSLDRIDMIALNITNNKWLYDLLLFLRQFLLLTISRNLFLNQGDILLIVICQSFFDVAYYINAH